MRRYAEGARNLVRENFPDLFEFSHGNRTTYVMRTTLSPARPFSRTAPVRVSARPTRRTGTEYELGTKFNEQPPGTARPLVMPMPPGNTSRTIFCDPVNPRRNTLVID